MAQDQALFNHADPSIKREFDNVYQVMRSLRKSLLLSISEVEPDELIEGLRWYQPTTDTLKEWTGTAWKQIYPGVFAA